SSDDGSRLWLHGALVVDNDGHHGMRRVRGRVPLRAGLHPLRIEWFNGVGPGDLEVTWSGPAVGRDVPLPEGALFR
ncbi:MAG: PA14 domain-containing protein, partial [Planctomycetota bacterium]